MSTKKKAAKNELAVVKGGGEMTGVALNEGPFAFAVKLAEVIAEPTPKEYLRTKPGRGNLTYVEVGYVRRQLTKTFGICWSFETTPVNSFSEAMAAGHVVVKGTLRIVNPKDGRVLIERQQYGGQPIQKNCDMGDMWKGAASDALKKCASMLGIAQDIFEMKVEATEREVEAKEEKAAELSASKVAEIMDGQVVNEETADLPPLARFTSAYKDDERIDVRAVATIAKLFKENGLEDAGKDFMREHFDTILTSKLNGRQYRELMAWIMDQDPENPPF